MATLDKNPRQCCKLSALLFATWKYETLHDCSGAMIRRQVSYIDFAIFQGIQDERFQ